MKKILIATNSLDIGGVETNILELVTGIIEQGKYIPVVVSNGGNLVNILNKHNIKHYEIHLNDKNPLYYIPNLIRLNKVIKKEKIDLIHSHARIPSFICNIMATIYHIPFVTSVHYPFKVNFIYRHLSKWGDKIIAVSDDLAKYVLDNYKVKNKNISIINNGIDTDKFNKNIDNTDIITKYHLSKNTNKIVHISRLDSTTCKTVNILIDIFSKLDKEIKNLELIIVGNGTEYKNLCSKADKVNQKIGQKRIKLVGSVYDGVNQFTSLADLFIGVSRSALEAMSEEKNVILSGDQGYLGLFTLDKLDKAISTNFCCRTEENVAANILLKDIITYFNKTSKETKDKNGKHNREIVLKYYSKKRMVEDTCKIYDDVINRYN